MACAQKIGTCQFVTVAESTMPYESQFGRGRGQAMGFRADSTRL